MNDNKLITFTLGGMAFLLRVLPVCFSTMTESNFLMKKIAVQKADMTLSAIYLLEAST